MKEQEQCKVYLQNMDMHKTYQQIHLQEADTYLQVGHYLEQEPKYMMMDRV